MKGLKLKLNHIFFWWYYKRVPEFFHQWPLLKSITMLKQNYEHQEVIIEGNNKVISSAIKHEEKLERELSAMRIQLIGRPDIAHKLNDMFKTDLPDGNEN